MRRTHPITWIALGLVAVVAAVALVVVFAPFTSSSSTPVVSTPAGDSAPAARPLAPESSMCLPDADDRLTSTIDSGPFTFRVEVYSDPSLRSRTDASHPSQASDIEGLGWRWTWTYNGPLVEAPSGHAAGLVASLGPEVPLGVSALESGQTSSRFGGIVLPEDTAPGDHIELAVRTRIRDEVFGALLGFNVDEREGRFVACDILITEDQT